MMGGLTAVNCTRANPLGVPALTNDVYYLQYIPAAQPDNPDADKLPGCAPAQRRSEL